MQRTEPRCGRRREFEELDDAELRARLHSYENVLAESDQHDVRAVAYAQAHAARIVLRQRQLNSQQKWMKTDDERSR